MPFVKRELVRVKFMNNSDAVVRMLESLLPQKDLMIIEETLMPPPNEAQVKEAKIRALAILVQECVPETDLIVTALREALKPAPVAEMKVSMMEVSK